MASITDPLLLIACTLALILAIFAKWDTSNSEEENEHN